MTDATGKAEEAGSREGSVTPRARRRVRPPAAVVTWRDDVRARPVAGPCYRLGVAILGGGIVLAGILMLPLPGPGWVVIFIGLEVLASEFAWAARLRTFTHAQVRRWTGWVTSRSRTTRTALGAATVLALVVGGWLAVRWAGLPGFAPDVLGEVPGWTRIGG